MRGKIIEGEVIPSKKQWGITKKTKLGNFRMEIEPTPELERFIAGASQLFFVGLTIGGALFVLSQKKEV